jgi:hypothetical protein
MAIADYSYCQLNKPVAGYEVPDSVMNLPERGPERASNVVI